MFLNGIFERLYRNLLKNALIMRKNDMFTQACSRSGTTASDYNYYYFEEYKKLYISSYMLSGQIKELLRKKDDLTTKLARLERKTEDFNDEVRVANEEKKKRNRRPASQIPRHYQCVVEKCRKLYGSEGSLHQHIKIKHPEIYTGETQVNQEEEPSDYT